LAAFATVEDFATYIRITENGPPGQLSAADAATVTFLLDHVTSSIRTRTGQFISKVEDDVVTLDAQPSNILSLPELPVTAVTSVTVGGVLLSSTFYTWNRNGIIRRSGIWGYYPKTVVVVYTHGYATIPDDLKMATCELAARAFQSGSGGSLAAVTESLESGYSYTERYAEAGSEGMTIDPEAIIARYAVPLVA
jgi:hypothetical protein